VITLSERPTQYYYIGGEITMPGQKVYHAEVTLMQAILSAGGVMTRAKNVVEIAREGADGRVQTTRYWLKEIKGGKVPDPRLKPGDLIEVR
jgi:protein involved in polysaccharide export with SLBB domain